MYIFREMIQVFSKIIISDYCVTPKIIVIIALLLMALLLMLAYFLYLIIGGLIFHAIDYPGYKIHREESKYAGLEWLGRYM